MTKFEHAYELTEAIPSATAAARISPSITAPAGVYDSGLIVLLDDELGTRVLHDWQWLLVDAVGLASTAQGNIFFWSPKQNGCFYLDTQRGKTTFVEKKVEALIDVFFTTDGVKKDVLFSGNFSLIVERIGDLKYCECYIAKPWQMLGGSGEIDTLGKGDLEVYVSLTGQTIKNVMPKR